MTLEELKAYRNIKARLNGLDERIERLKSAMESTTQTLSIVPGGEKMKDRMAEQMGELWELTIRRNEEVVRLEDAMEAVETFISNLPEQQGKVIRLRYVDGMSWNGVAEAANYGKRHCYKIHSAALQKMAPNGTRISDKL